MRKTPVVEMVLLVTCINFGKFKMLCATVIEPRPRFRPNLAEMLSIARLGLIFRERCSLCYGYRLKLALV